MIDTLERIQELYRNGGMKGVYRGMRDYITTHKTIPLVPWMLNTAEITAAGETISINITDTESYWRSDGFGETEMLNDFTESVDNDTIVWDVGANIGIYSLLAAEKGAIVYSFEPGIKALYHLHENMKLNNSFGNIIPINVALSDNNEYIPLSESDRTGNREVITEGNNRNNTVVPAVKGDSVIGDSPDILKIDVEGHENYVLDGMDTVLKCASTVYIEIHDVPRFLILTKLWDNGFTVTKEWGNNMRLDK